MRLGLGLGLCNVRSGASVYDPAADSWTLWNRASYTGSPWVGTSSAGTSGSRDLTEATNPPGTGAAINGRTPADFDGSNDRFFVHAWTSLFSLGAGTAAVVLNCRSAANEVTTHGYDEAQLVGSTDAGGSMGLSVHKSGATYRVRAHLADSGGFKKSVRAFSLNTWTSAIMRWDSSFLYLRVGGVDVAPLAAGAVASMSGNTIFGNSYQGLVFYDGLMAEILCGNTCISDAKVLQLESYFTARYGT